MRSKIHWFWRRFSARRRWNAGSPYASGEQMLVLRMQHAPSARRLSFLRLSFGA
jgi:hypothetical protein